eukprot:7767557-Pyramimonas_sp.AAC.1
MQTTTRRCTDRYLHMCTPVPVPVPRWLIVWLTRGVVVDRVVGVAGEYIGEDTFFQPNMAVQVHLKQAFARQDVIVAVFPYRSLEELNLSRPDLAIDIINHMAKRVSILRIIRMREWVSLVL